MYYRCFANICSIRVFTVVFAVLMFFVFQADILAEVNNTKGKGFAIIKRINSSSGIAICDVQEGIFRKNDLVDIYTCEGDKISSGDIRSIYSREIYMNITESDASIVRPGFLVFKNFSIYEVEDFLDRSDDTFKSCKQAEINKVSTPQGVVIKYIQKAKPPVNFSHYNHEKLIRECTDCHHKGDSYKCIDCHKVKKERTVIDLKEAFHIQCKGCHQNERKGPTKCDDCHRK